MFTGKNKKTVQDLFFLTLPPLSSPKNNLFKIDNLENTGKYSSLEYITQR